MPRYLTQHTLACLTRQGAEALAQRMQTGVFWTLPLDMIHSEIRFPLLPIMLQTVIQSSGSRFRFLF